MIPVTITLDDHTPDYGILRGGFSPEPLAAPAPRDMRLEVMALDDARNIVLRYTGRVVVPIEISISQDPDIELIKRSCRELAKYLGWEVVEP